MQRNSNGVEPGPMQERDVLARDVVLAVLLPECGRPFGSEEFKYQRADLTRRLRTTFKQPHVTLWHQPIAEICCANKERFPRGIDDLFVVSVRELRVCLGNQHQKKKRHLQKSEHDSSRRKAYTKLAACSGLEVHVVRFGLLALSTNQRA